MKLKEGQFNQVSLDFIPLNSWLKTRTKVKDSKCQECGKKFEDLKSDIALLTVHGEVNWAICHNCGEEYIKLGAVDVKLNQRKVEELKNKILTLNSKLKLDGKSLLELEEILLEQEKLDKEIKDKYSKIESDRLSISKEDWEFEEYLKTEYGVIQDERWLYSEEQIEAYFSDDCSDYFDCGQGYYEDRADVIIKIGKKFYSVHLKADICSAKQDYGDRLYWVEGLVSVSWEEIEKPKKKARVELILALDVNMYELEDVLSFIKRNNINVLKKEVR